MSEGTSPVESLADALDRIATSIEALTEEAGAIHRDYLRVLDSERRRLDDVVGDEVRKGRVEVGLYAAALLVEQLRAEARQAHRRFAEIDLRGERLAPMPPSLHPLDVRAWWAALPVDDRAALSTARPAWVGSLDGVPAADRHTANLRVLDAEITRRRTQLPDVELDGVGDDTPEAADLRGLLKLRDFLDGGGPAQVSTPASERWLYLLDTNDFPLKAGVLLGDLTTADHVVIHVPGATTTVDLRFHREMTWMHNLRTEAGRLLGDENGRSGVDRVAVLDWIGYHAPHDITARRSLGTNGLSLIVPGEAINESYAREAAPALLRCAEGVRALVGPHVRLISSGHSYGGSLTGLVLMTTDVYDASVVAGCPGMFGTRLEDFHVPEESFFISITPTDLVGMLGVFGVECLKIPRVKLLSPYARRVTYPDGARAVLIPSVGHEMYYNHGTSTLHGIAAVVAGRLASVKTTTWLGMIRSDGERRAESGSARPS